MIKKRNLIKQHKLGVDWYYYILGVDGERVFYTVVYETDGEFYLSTHKDEIRISVINSKDFKKDPIEILVHNYQKFKKIRYKTSTGCSRWVYEKDKKDLKYELKHGGSTIVGIEEIIL